MDDVLGQVVLSGGDEDLLPLDPVGTVRAAERPGRHSAHVRARVRLGEAHGPAPLSAEHLLQVQPLLPIAAEATDEACSAPGEQGEEVSAALAAQKNSLQAIETHWGMPMPPISGTPRTGL